MIYNSSVRMAHECGTSREAVEKATKITCMQVSILASDRYNSLYDETDLHQALIPFLSRTDTRSPV